MDMVHGSFGADSQALPGAGLEIERMPAHWVLARLGKRVLRPGGLELTRWLLDFVRSSDQVIELAPGLGVTARLLVKKGVRAYVGVERDPQAAELVRKAVSAERPGLVSEVLVGTAQQVPRPDGSADVVFSEALLSMQPEALRARIIAEAARLLRPGGRYLMHELGLVAGLTPSARDSIERELSRALHVGARPCDEPGLRAHLEAAGFDVMAVHTTPMRLLEPERLIADEGLAGALKFVWNAARDRRARARVLQTRASFRRHRTTLCAIGLVAVKRAAG